MEACQHQDTALWVVNISLSNRSILVSLHVELQMCKLQQAKLGVVTSLQQDVWEQATLKMCKYSNKIIVASSRSRFSSQLWMAKWHD